MVFTVYDINELEKSKGYRCVWCLVISSATIKESRRESLHIYETERQRDNAMNYWQREYKLQETVFFIFEIPIDFYLQNAEKRI